MARFLVHVIRVGAETHDALLVAAVHQAEQVPQLMHRLFDGPLLEKRPVGGLAEELGYRRCRDSVAIPAATSASP